MEPILGILDLRQKCVIDGIPVQCRLFQHRLKKGKNVMAYFVLKCAGTLAQLLVYVQGYKIQQP